MPNTVKSDLLALGSTLYGLVVGEAPYSGAGDDEIARRYAREVFPDLTGTFCGDVILDCWKGEFPPAEDAYLRYKEVTGGYCRRRL
ncbi:hypothetical protein BDY21DRAFT_79380 [Lineolata rhizophorae]|uniref:Protein kinase domain-containing protein n=1 Tax=Lineolata rhizophorae TaxID=578093 RepID=A0A6A6NUE7_9PEZI|nr:hypothetical protein BDY21DRAFT_79380 [Lineolata rhizophorae]